MRPRSRLVVLPAIGALVAAALAGAPGSTAAPPAAAPGDGGLEVYVGEVAAGQLPDLVALGIDRHELELAPVGSQDDLGSKGLVEVEAVLSADQAEQLAAQGLDLEVKQVDGQSVTERADARSADGYEVWQTYAGDGGIAEELRQVAAAHPGITKLVTAGQTVQGQDILALKVTDRARRTRDGARPAVLYLSAQHAREWITPEMTTRLLARVVERYAAGDRRTRRLLATTELWFMPVANPDGYDYTFTEGNRLWRKNLRDNDGDGTTAPGDGVDLNRNWPYKWGYDNEGSSPDPAGETYRGPGPASEPETQALDALADRVGFEFLVNYHSAAELLLYGTGWQVATPSPDDLVYEALAGDDAEPAVAGYDPDLSAELYTTNGDTDSGITEEYGTLGFTPEMSTCEAASGVDPDDEWVAEDCGSGFEFPDDEQLVQGEFEKNVPFALSVARSAADPDEPRSSLGLEAPAFEVDSFDVSYGDPQTVAVDARRSLGDKELRYRVDGGPVRRTSVTRWRGGETYGRDNDSYYAEYRGTVRGTQVGDRVTAWFTGRDDATRRDPGTAVRSERFRYTVESDSGADVLVVADEDYTGVNPTYPAGTDAPAYAAAHVQAIEDAGYTADVWDVDAQGVPHDLGVLGHYDAVLWYLGDNRLTQDPEDEETDTPFGPLPDVSVAEGAQDLTIAVRDYLNEGGKLVHAGETAQYQGLPGISDAVGGLYYGLNGDPVAECVVEDQAGFFEDCLILADDFRQYWLGAFNRFDSADPEAVEGLRGPLGRFRGVLGGPVVAGSNPLDEAGSFQVTSDVLPVEDFPQFASRGAATYPVQPGDPLSPVEGERYAGVLHADSSWARLTRTIDLAGAMSAELQMATSWNTEEGYDHLVVEARTAGGSDWTTLAEVGGATSTTPPAECEAGFFLELHPFLTSYLGGDDCTGPGSTGTWSSLTGVGGWEDLAYDLTAFAGDEVEVSVGYVTDPSTGGIGAFVDDTRVEVDGADRFDLADGFEGATSLWAPGTTPPGSPPTSTDWQIGGLLVESVAATSTDDTLLLGFGLEQLASDRDRARLVRRALDGLLGSS